MALYGLIEELVRSGPGQLEGTAASGAGVASKHDALMAAAKLARAIEEPAQGGDLDPELAHQMASLLLVIRDYIEPVGPVADEHVSRYLSEVVARSVRTPIMTGFFRLAPSAQSDSAPGTRGSPNRPTWSRPTLPLLRPVDFAVDEFLEPPRAALTTASGMTSLWTCCCGAISRSWMPGGGRMVVPDRAGGSPRKRTWRVVRSKFRSC